ncbi:protein ACCELERATED CELL DEATH 6-like [Ipomoea triloba]|uniref:protein ACCELERATED CELL DEATH 6-like n=1 Tax=Ipomoea triloba TaxID=35885 RepID=UPI00125D4EBE|nr:protein ACCELERATED CELL DEATH 6-like [Ipomoea triloba]
MEPAMGIPHMKPALYRAAAAGTLEDYHEALRQMTAEGAEDCQVAPNGNTVLHVAVLHGNKHFVEEILEEQMAHAAASWSMLFARNNKNETVLHCAAEKGYADIVSVLIKAIKEYEDAESGVGVKEMIQMTDDVMDTALHKAVRMGHLEVVKLLIEEDNEFLYPPNDAGETPIYLAAESHSFYCLEKILETCTNPTYGGPWGRNALHVAILSPGIPTTSWEMLMRSLKSVLGKSLKSILLGHHAAKAECIQLLLEKKISLCEMIDEFGWTPLHYAVQLRDDKTVGMILEKKSSAAYIRAGKGDDWTTIFHIAARHGNIKTMKYISNRFPNCWTMINCKSQNVLHEAILSGRVNMIKYILKDLQMDNLVDQKDRDGNTPLHLLSFSSWSHVDYNHIVTRLKRKHFVFNKRHQTPHDLFNQPINAFKYISGGIPQRSGRRSGPRVDLAENQETASREDTDNVEGEINRMLRMSKTMTIIATLILTITFAAGFTVPGGYDSNSGSKQAGKPILFENTAFMVFVYSDSIAFVCSILSILIYIRMVSEASSSSKKYTTIASLYHLEAIMIVNTTVGVVVAFISGMYATLSLANEVLFIGLLLLLIVVEYKEE